MLELNWWKVFIPVCSWVCVYRCCAQLWVVWAFSPSTKYGRILWDYWSVQCYCIHLLKASSCICYNFPVLSLPALLATSSWSAFCCSHYVFGSIPSTRVIGYFSSRPFFPLFHSLAPSPPFKPFPCPPLMFLHSLIWVCQPVRACSRWQLTLNKH